MTLPKPWPRSLGGQLALVIALALFVAQSINFAMVLRERAEFRLVQATRPAATRLADAIERETATGQSIPTDRGRIRRVATSPVPPYAISRRPEAAVEIRRQLAEAGVSVGRIEAWVENRSDEGSPEWLRRRGGRPASVLRIAVEQPGRGWLIASSGWPQPGPRILVSLLAQTLILYAIVLLPMLWLARRIARPLRTLAASASAFRPGGAADPVEESGPSDVRAVIAAYNGLGTRVSAMLDEKDRMLGAIGHDLRTPLAALRVRIESVEDDNDRARMADTIDEMARTLEDILSLARLGRPSEPPVETDLGALVDAVVDDFRELGADIDAEDPERLPMRVRPAQMRRAVRNLIENAIKYAGAAEVRVVASPGNARIEVADRGPGIPEDRLLHVFDAFVRVETSRNRATGGIGLGLALARAIVAEAGGTLSLANRDGGGLVASIVLPR